MVEISLNTIADNMDNAVQVQDSTATITGNEIRNNGQTGILVTTDACAVINGGMIANSGKAGVHLQRDSFAAIGFGAEAAGNLTLTQNVGDGITIADDSSFALINRARVIFDANGGGEIVGLDFTANPADPRVDQIRCFMP